ncbi:Farnesyl pyrophosphate synthase, partial [Galemys pyrenaicus]
NEQSPKLEVYAQEKQDFIQQYSQIVKVLTEDELRDLARSWNSMLLEVTAFQVLVKPRKQDAGICTGDSKI